jgi:hypothetical protein
VPANDAFDRRAVILALVDDLAALAAELSFSGRLGHQDPRSATEIGNKQGDDDV